MIRLGETHPTVHVVIARARAQGQRAVSTYTRKHIQHLAWPTNTMLLTINVPPVQPASVRTRNRICARSCAMTVKHSRSVRAFQGRPCVRCVQFAAKVHKDKNTTQRVAPRLRYGRFSGRVKRSNGRNAPIAWLCLSPTIRERETPYFCPKVERVASKITWNKSLLLLFT